MNTMLLKVNEGKMTISHQIRNNGDENKANEMKLYKRIRHDRSYARQENKPR